MRAFMNTMTAFAVVALMAAPLMARDNAGTWSADFSVGGTASVAPSNFSDAFPKAFTLNSNVTYMINDNVGLVPLAITGRTFESKIHDGEDLVKDGQPIPSGASVVDGSVSTFPSDATLWSIAYTPGVMLRTNPLIGSFELFGQVGVGVEHFGKKTTEFGFSTQDKENKFAMLLGGGFEMMGTDNLGFIAKVSYDFVNTDIKSSQLVDFTGGIKYAF